MFRRLIDINLTGSFLMSQAVGKAMIAAGKPGSIVLVASMSRSIVSDPQEQSCCNGSFHSPLMFRGEVVPLFVAGGVTLRVVI